MADTSIFGDASLFDEFEREPEPSDKILKQKLMTDERLDQRKSIDDGSDSAFSTEFHIGSSQDSCSESEDDFIDNGSDHGGGITGVGETLHLCQNQIGRELNGGRSASDSERYMEIRKQMDELSQEKQQLKKKVRMLTCDRILNKEEEGPALQVIFMNHPVSRKYKTEIEEFIQHLIQNDNKDEELRYLNLRPTSVCFSENATKVFSSRNEKTRQVDKTSSIGCDQFYRDFILDAMGWPLVEYNPSMTDGWLTPRYEQFYSESLPLEEDDEGDMPKKPQRPKASCFNCGGEHNLSECKERKDFKKINKARKDFMDSRSPANNTLKKQRYILNENETKEGGFKPGVIGKNLREAMGINSEQLPPYIYQMRRLGYPPGWLLDAEVSGSGVAIFDRYGKEVSKDRNAGEEEGEIDVNKDKRKYNMDKFLSYPGFNVDLPKGTIDEYQKLDMLPMQQHQQKVTMQSSLAAAKLTLSGKKRKLERDDSVGDVKKSKNVDMDLDQSDDDVGNQEARGSSPTLRNLENQQQLLKVQLAAMEVLNGDSQEEGEIMDDSFIPPVPPTPEPPPLPPGTPPVTPKTPSTSVHLGSRGETGDDSKFKTPLSVTPSSLARMTTPTGIPLPDDAQINSDADNEASNMQEILRTPDCKNGHLFRSSKSSSGSVSSTVGTPVLEGGGSCGSVVSKGLPEASKFAAGITEHMPFENLPESTGKYKQMKKVLEWVRSKN